jgi:hypothetical protein
MSVGVSDQHQKSNATNAPTVVGRPSARRLLTGGRAGDVDASLVGGADPE